MRCTRGDGGHIMPCIGGDEKKSIYKFATELDKCDILRARVIHLLNCINLVTGDSYPNIINKAVRNSYQKTFTKSKKSKQKNGLNKCKRYILCLFASNPENCEMMTLKELLEKYFYALINRKNEKGVIFKRIVITLVKPQNPFATGMTAKEKCGEKKETL